MKEEDVEWRPLLAAAEAVLATAAPSRRCVGVFATRPAARDALLRLLAQDRCAARWVEPAFHLLQFLDCSSFEKFHSVGPLIENPFLPEET